MTKKDKPEKGRVFTVANLKGGVGKSSLACNLACYLDEVGKAAVIDLDTGQRDSERFAGIRGLTMRCVEDAGGLYDAVELLNRDGFDVVIDCPPGEKAETKLACYMASAVVMPTRPGTNDAHGIGRLLSMIREIRQERPDLPVYAVCNFFKNSTEARSMVEILKQMGSATFLGKLWDRKDYSVSIGDGLPVWESVPGKPAAIEMRGICEALNRMVVS